VSSVFASQTGSFATATEIVLYDENGAVVTLGASERLEVHACYVGSLVTSGVELLQVFLDTDNDNTIDAGEVIFSAAVGAFGVNAGGPVHALGEPGAKPHVIRTTGAGTSHTVNLYGVIRRVS